MGDPEMTTNAIKNELDWKFQKQIRKSGRKKTTTKTVEKEDDKIVGIAGGLPTALEVDKHQQGYQGNLVRSLPSGKLQNEFLTTARKAALMVTDPDMRLKKIKNLKRKKEQIKRDRRLVRKHVSIAHKKMKTKSEKKKLQELGISSPLYKELRGLTSHR